MDFDDLLIFMHIPKTGGTTLLKILEQQYNRNELWYGNNNLPSKKEANILKCITGHFSFGVHSFYSRKFKYFTMVRHPVDRLVSLYFQILSDKEHHFYKDILPLSFEEFILNNKFNVLTVNQQVKFFAGKGYISCHVDDSDLEQAKKNLEFFTVVGLTERFNESLFLMKKLHGWNEVFFKKANTRIISKNTKKSLKPEIKNIILEKNQLDLTLFEYINKRLDDQINELNEYDRQLLKNFNPDYAN